MKRMLFWIVLLTLALAGCVEEAEESAVTDEEMGTAEMESAAEPSEEETRGQADATINDAEISIDYGRPALQGRNMKEQAEDGFVWRLGMNEATTIETSKDLQFGDTMVPAGTYTIFAKKVGGDEWHLIFNEETGLWGAFDYDESKDKARVPLQMTAAGESADRLVIDVNSTGDNSGEIVIHWGNDQLKADFTVS